MKYGASVDQSIRLAGAKVALAGAASSTHEYHIPYAISAGTAAVLFVVSHHAVQYGQLSLEEVGTIAKPKGIPVIVDTALHYDLKGFLARGADAGRI